MHTLIPFLAFVIMPGLAMAIMVCVLAVRT